MGPAPPPPPEEEDAGEEGDTWDDRGRGERDEVADPYRLPVTSEVALEGALNSFLSAHAQPVSEQLSRATCMHRGQRTAPSLRMLRQSPSACMCACVQQPHFLGAERTAAAAQGFSGCQAVCI